MTTQNNNDNPTCPHCFHYNAVLDGKCRDCHCRPEVPHKDCLVYVESTGTIGKVLNGQTGYIALSSQAFTTTEAKREHIATMNRVAGVSENEAEAMSTCSMFGSWHIYNDILDGLNNLGALEPIKPTLTAKDITDAVDAGHTVTWRNPTYKVIRDENGQYLITNKTTRHAIGLTWSDGTTLNGKPEDFEIVKRTTEDRLYVFVHRLQYLCQGVTPKYKAEIERIMADAQRLITALDAEMKEAK